MNHVCLLLPLLLRVSAWRLALICQQCSLSWQPQPGGFSLDLITPQDRKSCGSHSCRSARPSLEKGLVTGKKCYRLCPNAWMNCYTMQTPKLSNSVFLWHLWHLLGPVSTAVPLTISLHIFFSRGPGGLGVEKARKCWKGPWTCYIL